MKVSVRVTCLLAIVASLMLTACLEVRAPETLPVELPELTDLITRPTPTPLPTSVPGILKFTAVNYRADLAPSARVPGTPLVYLSQEFDTNNELTYNVSINNEVQAKRVGDSFYWQGILAPGVQATYDLRLGRAFSADAIKATGSVELNLFNPNPIASDFPDCSALTLCFDEVLYDTMVREGETLPGTTYLFLGESGGSFSFSAENGEKRDYRMNDSLVWQGGLLDNVFANYDLRLVTYEAGELRLRGDVGLRIFGR